MILQKKNKKQCGVCVNFFLKFFVSEMGTAKKHENNLSKIAGT